MEKPHSQITIYKNDNGKFEVDTLYSGNIFASTCEFETEYEAAKEGLIMFKR